MNMNPTINHKLLSYYHKTDSLIKERKTMKNKIIRNKKEKLIIENKKLHTET